MKCTLNDLILKAKSLNEELSSYAVLKYIVGNKDRIYSYAINKCRPVGCANETSMAIMWDMLCILEHEEIPEVSLTHVVEREYINVVDYFLEAVARLIVLGLTCDSKFREYIYQCKYEVLRYMYRNNILTFDTLKEKIGAGTYTTQEKGLYVGLCSYYNLIDSYGLVGSCWIQAREPIVECTTPGNISRVRVELTAISGKTIKETKACRDVGVKMAMAKVARIPTMRVNKELLKHLAPTLMTYGVGFATVVFEWKESFAYEEV